MSPNPQTLILSHPFAAPRLIVYKAWTDSEALAQWWGPRGFTNALCEVHARPGGSLRIVMVSPEGLECPVKGVFRELLKPERILFVIRAFEDEEGRPALEALNTLSFTDHGARSTLTLRVDVLRAEPEVAFVLAGLEAGCRQSLDRLEAFLAAA